MKNGRRILCVLLAVLMMAGCFLASCNIITGDTVMEYEGYEITEAMYSYWMLRHKLMFLQAYGSDWDAKIDGEQTYAEFVQEFVNDYAKQVLISMYLFDKHSLEFDDQTKSDISQRIEMLKQNYGGKKALNSALKQYGLNIDTLEDIYYEQEKLSIVKEYLFESGGQLSVTDAERISYYTSNYYCYDRLLIYTEWRPKLSSAGSIEYDANGQVIRVELSDEEKAKSAQLIDSIIAQLESGEKSFNVLRNEYSEEDVSGFNNYPDGVIICPNDEDPDTEHTAKFIKAIQSIEVGGYTLCENNAGSGKFIIVRRQLKDFSELTETEIYGMSNFETYVVDNKSDSYFNSFKIKQYDDVMQRYNVKAIGVLKDYNI